MKKRIAAVMLAAVLGTGILAGCGSDGSSAQSTAAPAAASETEETAEEAGSGTEETGKEAVSEAEETKAEAAAPVEDGVYLAEFKSDSSMFHVNETKDGKGILTVGDGKMTIHITLASKKIVNLYPGLSEDAKKDGAELLQPTEDEVTYSDGTTDVVYGFDLPVPVLDEEFDCALVGTKGKWYDHKVIVSNPEPYTEES